MSAVSRAAILAEITAKIITGSSNTTAANTRGVLSDINDSSLNKTDDVNVSGGYLGIDSFGRVDASFIKVASPVNKFLRDDGTYQSVLVGSSTLNQVLTAGNASSGKSSIWSNGDYIYLGSSSNSKLYWDNTKSASFFIDSSTLDGLEIKAGSAGVSLRSPSGNVVLGTTSHILSLDEASGFDLEINGGSAQIAISQMTNQVYVFSSTVINLDAPNVLLSQETASRSVYVNASNQLKSSTIHADGNNLFFASGYGIDSVVTAPPTSILNIGATNAAVINYGNSATVHNFLGTAIYELQVNSYVTDKLITLNYGGAVSSGIGVGFEIQENNVITGYFKTNAARSGWSFKAPANSTYTDLVFSATSVRTMSFPDRDLTIDNITTSTTSNGSGFVKANGSVISFDNSTYLTTSSASNGLTSTSSTIKLGGALTGATNITGAQTLSLGTTGSRFSNLINYSTTSTALFAGASGSPSAYSTLFIYGASNNYTAGFQSTNGTDIVEVVSTPTTYQILLTATNPIIDINNAGATVANNGTNNVFVVNDALSKGIVYASDYSSNFTPESLVSKRWVGAGYQPLDSDLTTIAGLTATTDNFIVSVSSAWASRTPAQVKTTLSLNNVENTALSTWAGTTNITTLGTVTTGTWNASKVAIAYGGTNSTSQVNNGVNYFDGTSIKSLATFLFDGTNFGIGATPQVLLTVSKQTTIVAPVSGSSAQFVGLDASPLRLTYDTHNNSNASGTAFMVRRSRGTAATPLALSANDDIASFNGRGYGSTGYAASSTGLLVFKSNQTFTDANMGTYFSVYTTPDNSVTAAEMFRVAGSGAISLFGTGGTGYLSFPAQSSNSSAPSASGFNLFAGSTGSFNWSRKNGTDTFVRTFDATLTADRTYTLQDSSDTLIGRATTDTLTNKTLTSAILITPTGSSGQLSFSNSATATGSLINYLFTNASHTNQTLSVNAPDFKVVGATKQWATGSLATQYWNYFTTPTATFVGASTLALSTTIFAEAATTGTNATITNNFIYGGIAGTGTFFIGNLTGSTTQMALYSNQATPSTSNYTLRIDASNNTFVGGGQVFISPNNTTTLSVVNTGTTSPAVTISVPSFTSTVTTNNAPIFKVIGATRTWAAGNIALQYFNWLTTNTLTISGGASTATFTSNLVVEYVTRGTTTTIGTSAAIYVPTLALSTTTTAAGLIIDQCSGATNNFTSMERYDASNYFTTQISSTGSATFALTGTTPKFTFSQQIINSAPIRIKNYIVSGLPTGAQGDVAYVTDALAPSFLVAVVGGGAVVAPVFYNGSSWVTF